MKKYRIRDDRDIVIFHPDIYLHKTNNEYTINTYNIIKDTFCVKSLEWFIRHPFNKRVKFLYLNWYENTLDGKSGYAQYFQYAIKLLILKFSKFRKIKILYVIHNKTPHNIELTSKLYINLVKPFIRKCLGISDYIIGLCEYTKDFLSSEYNIDVKQKIRIIPHGKYSKFVCDNNDIRKKYSIDNKDFVCCFVGKMDKYKNIDILIEGFYKANIDARVLLVGKCEQSYQEELIRRIKDNRVVCDFSFVTDEYMSKVIQSADAIILPYNNTSLNSGIMINSFSNGTTVIGTDIGMLRDYPEDLVYMYSHDDIDHVDRLKEAIEKAYLDFSMGELSCKGMQLERLVEIQNSWSNIRRILLSLLN